METKRIDVPCPWCGIRCCNIDSRFREWVCGSKSVPTGLTGISWQSPGCRVREIDNASQSTEIAELKAEIKRLRTKLSPLTEKG